jgi:hypothetical protein
MSTRPTTAQSSIDSIKKLQIDLESYVPNELFALERSEYIKASNARRSKVDSLIAACSARSADGSTTDPERMKNALQTLTSDSKRFPWDNRASKDCTGAVSIQQLRKIALDAQDVCSEYAHIRTVHT